MEYVIWPFAIMGFVAFCSMGGLNTRIAKLERQLATVNGSQFHEEKISLMKVLQGYIGKNVVLEMRGERTDLDLVNATVRKGSCIVLDVDRDWVLIRVAYDKTEKEKLFRLSEISGVKEGKDLD